jgi:uncharacterized protein (TIGR03382 family)
MCGGFALHLSGGSRAANLLRQVLWHTGKTSTYVFLGALAGFLGGRIGDFLKGPWIHAISCAAGGVMILMGLVLLGLLPRRRRRTEDGEVGLLSSVFRQFSGQPTPAAALVLGLASGFLPCPIVVGFLALSVQSGSALAGVVLMAAMGVGTMWALLLVGMGGGLMKSWLRRRGAILGGVVLVLLGAATILRGTEVFHRTLGCTECQREAATTAPASQPATGSARAAPARCPHCSPQTGEAREP